MNFIQKQILQGLENEYIKNEIMSINKLASNVYLEILTIKLIESNIAVLIQINCTNYSLN
jgi:hypothetical protein